MFQTRSEYDRGVNTFSPEGRLFQVEYAIEAIKLGSTTIAIKTKFGIVLAVEKRITSTLMEPGSMDKIMEIDEHCAAAVSGLTADARTMVEHGRVESQNHYFTFNEAMPVESLCQTLCRLAMSFGGEGEKSMSRPFGVALLVAGCDAEDRANEQGGYSLFHVDPSGTKTRCKAKAIGSGSEGAQTALNDEYRDDLTLEEAETMAMSTLKAVMEEKVNTRNVDFAVLAPKYQVYGAEKIQAIIDRAV
jgi:20S proteasome subunit alpha 5